MSSLIGVYRHQVVTISILTMKNAFLLLSLSFISFITTSQASDFGWLSGQWTGAGFGGTFEEIWSEPDANGNLMGMFRYSDEEGEIQFYEFWILDSSGLKLKHFNPDFSGWEEKADFIDFSMIEASKNKIILKGLTYELINENELEIHLDLKEGEEITTEVFLLKKKL